MDKNTEKVTDDAEVYIAGDLTELNSWLEEHKKNYSGILILADDRTAKLCLPVLSGKVTLLQSSRLITFHHGEENKTIESAISILNKIIEAGSGRNVLLLNLGGGVVTDLGGFVASIYKRGIDHINLPTTLLAMVDASFGGKNGVDLYPYKNMIGTFYPAKAVFIYPGFLKTLPQRQIVSGFAEVVKHALIADADYFKYLCEYPDLPSDWSRVIGWSVRIKQHYVQADPFDKGLRRVLNFGHTIGHAVETLSFVDEPLLHGEAVAIGMICESWLSHRLLQFPVDSLGKITEYISGVFPTRKIEEKDYEAIYLRMLHDKKNDGRLRFTLLRAVGEPLVNQECEKEMVFESFGFYNNLC